MRRLISEGDIKGVKDRLAKLKLSFTAHDTYHDMLSEESEISASEQWFSEVENNYIIGVTTAKQWLHDQDDNISDAYHASGKSPG